MEKAGKTYQEKCEILFILLKSSLLLRHKVQGTLSNGNEIENIFQCFVSMYSTKFIVSERDKRIYLGVRKFPLSWQIPGKLVITFYILDAT